MPRYSSFIERTANSTLYLGVGELEKITKREITLTNVYQTRYKREIDPLIVLKMAEVRTDYFTSKRIPLSQICAFNSITEEEYLAIKNRN
ncbi:MAG: hypothetical protein ABIJ18_03330 [archaeon]